MDIIRKLHLFSWKDFQDDLNNLGDLERFKLVIETMPDGKLLSILGKLRGNGRNDHPVDAMWNSILAGIVFEHISVQSLRRELQRNAQLREMCGFDPLKGVKGVPSKSAYNRFMCCLLTQEPQIREMFDVLVKELSMLFPGFGKHLAGDGKAIHSLGRPSTSSDSDRRRERDADWGKKVYRGIGQDGRAWEKVKSWFGFRLHLLVDTDAELPVAYQVTKAAVGEQPVMRQMVELLNENHSELILRCENLMLDKGYDSEKTISLLWDKYQINPIIDIRNMWKDKESRTLRAKRVQNVTYDYKGTVFCHCFETGEIRRMAYGGFEKERQSLKYLCPALHYGLVCKGASKCPLYMKSIRIPLKEDRRIFTPVPRSSYKWKGLYNKRTSVERVNSRIDVSYGFERHYIRGLKKMEVRCGLALCVMLAISVGRAKQAHPELMRSLTRAVS
jgi:hypothetical protein